MSAMSDVRKALERAEQAAFRRFERLNREAKGLHFSRPEAQRAIYSFDVVAALRGLKRTLRRIEKKHGVLR